MPRWLIWLFALVLACAALGTWLLRADVLSTRPDLLDNPYRIRSWMLSDEYRDARVLLNRALRAQQLRAALPDTPALVIGLDLDTLPLYERAVRAAAEAEYRTHPVPRATVGLLFLDPPAQEVDSLRRDWQRSGYLAGGAPRAFCALVTERRDGDPRVPLPWRLRLPGAGEPYHPLGPCRLWARYGAPGPGVQAWLERGAIGFAMQAEIQVPRWWELKTPPFVRGKPYETDVGLEACRAGYRERCRAYLDNPRAVLGRGARSPVGVAATDDDLFWWWGDGPGKQVLAAMEKSVGGARFERFWRSPLPGADTAFLESYGKPMEVWAIEWIQDAYGKRRKGPRLAAGTVLLAFVSVGLLFGVAAEAGRRRRVG